MRRLWGWIMGLFRPKEKIVTCRACGEALPHDRNAPHPFMEDMITGAWCELCGGGPEWYMHTAHNDLKRMRG